ncbi:class I SAM-dependent methyltransferase [Streptomyces sp. NBC_01483]|uniref:class I SAM-dependent methyltransferase n=1 Tax=Streptomyces sp. NBC_01483 TaxID=2903883 RepID=UPI002E36BC9F|nr:hypothetical protein [Streptomyces sp. NBC_01483]
MIGLEVSGLEGGTQPLALAHGDVVLDVGSGFRGPACQLARRIGDHVVGIDITPAYVDAAHNPTWPLYKRDLGPTSTELFMQSNYGIVTKMGYRLMPKPEIYMPLWVQLRDDSQMPAVVDALRQLMLDGTIDMRPQLSNTLCMASMMTARAEWYDGPGAMPEEVIEKIAKDLRLGRWMMRFALYGDERRPLAHRLRRDGSQGPPRRSSERSVWRCAARR